MADSIVSRPRCPACFGAGTILHPLFDDEVQCPHCFGPGFDPFWMGPAVPAEGTATPVATPPANLRYAPSLGALEGC